MASLPSDTAGNVPGSNLGPYYVRLKVYDYKRPNLFEKSAGPVKGHFYLPLPDGLRDETTVQYADVDLMSMQDAFVAGTGASIGDRARAVASGAIIGQGIGTAAVKLFPISSLISAENVSAFVQQSLGAAQNPNPAVVFRGPELRDYQMSWTFAPRSQAESINTRNVIQALKRAALPAPRYQNTMAVLNYPALVQLNFYPWDKDGTGKYEHDKNKSIIRYKTSVMKTVNIDYAPSNTPSFYAKGNHPAFIRLNITFREVEYALSNDWGGVPYAGSGSIIDEIADIGREIGIPASVIDPAQDFFNRDLGIIEDLLNNNPPPPAETESGSPPFNVNSDGTNQLPGNLFANAFPGL